MRHRADVDARALPRPHSTQRKGLILRLVESVARDLTTPELTQPSARVSSCDSMPSFAATISERLTQPSARGSSCDSRVRIRPRTTPHSNSLNPAQGAHLATSVRRTARARGRTLFNPAQGAHLATSRGGAEEPSRGSRLSHNPAQGAHLATYPLATPHSCRIRARVFACRLTRPAHLASDRLQDGKLRHAP